MLMRTNESKTYFLNILRNGMVPWEKRWTKTVSSSRLAKCASTAAYTYLRGGSRLAQTFIKAGKWKTYFCNTLC